MPSEGVAVKCPNCGFENPDTAAFCSSCGKDMRSMGTRNCVSCGRSIAWNANVCPYCGKDYRIQAYAQPPQPLISSGVRVLLYIISVLIPFAGIIIGAIYYTKPEEEYKHVGKICLVIGVVMTVLSVGLSVLLYVMVLGFGGTTSTPGIMVTRKSSVPDGFKIEFSAPTSEISWSDVAIQLSDGWHTVSWTNTTTKSLTGTSPPEVWHYGHAQDLGTLSVFLNVTDLAANGRMNIGDYITLTTSGLEFSPSTTYTLTLLYEPTDGSMLAYDFTG
jgi:predicted RNA-binding Zn-ribbon protein involved in translation (DUF1610 family)